MPNTRTYNRSFAGGQISREMYGRIDDAKFQAGAATLRNFIATPTGAAENRAGFAYVNSTKNNGVARLIPFTYAINQTMVIELGDKYARFHTQGETLRYSTSGMTVWVAPSGNISFTYTTPTVVNWTTHGLSTGDPIRFYVNATNPTLPGGLQLGYTYTVQVIDANTFNILDGGTPVALTAPAGGGGGSTTNYPGTGTASVSLGIPPGQSLSAVGSPIGGLRDVPVSGGVVTLNATLSAYVYVYRGSGTVTFEYSTDSVTWHAFFQ